MRGGVLVDAWPVVWRGREPAVWTSARRCEVEFAIIRGMKPIATANYDFEKLINDGCVYVDKTDMLWKLAAAKDAIYFILRPRRFGKSLMLSTFKCLFQGKKKLFRGGLKIAKKKWNWAQTYPVIDLNMSDFDKAVYVFEFNKSAKAAVRQIREKGYADAYNGGRRRVTSIGINFNSKKRNIDEPIIEVM